MAPAPGAMEGSGTGESVSATGTNRCPSGSQEKITEPSTLSSARA